MIVIDRNGRRTVISGWREWLVWLAVAFGLVVIGGLVLGIALTVFSVALIAVPIAVVLAVIAGLLQNRT